MAEDVAAAGDGEQARPVRVSGGRWTAALALLVSLAALCGIAWLYYTLVLHDPAAGIAERLAALQAAQSRIGVDLERMAGERQAAFEAFRAELEERQRASARELAESLGGQTVANFPAERDWKLAEAEFLLRAANHRALYERDAGSALELLRSADGILGGLSGPAALGIRATIASEILSLEQADDVDPSAIYLRLDAIKGRLAELTLALPEYTATATDSTTVPETERAAPPADDAGSSAAVTAFTGQNTPVPAERSSTNGQPPVDDTTSPFPDTLLTAQSSRESNQPPPFGGEPTPFRDPGTAAEAAAPGKEHGFFSTLGRELGRLVRFRRIDTALERPPAPAESDLLAVNLRLMLEQAQLAALKRDQAVYAASLDSALDWTRALLNSRDTRVRETIESLEALRRLELNAPLPDVSASLNELLEARRAQP